MRRPGESIEVDWDLPITRTVHTTKKRPQVGYIWYEGQKRRVYIGFYGDGLIWKSPDFLGEQGEYDYCAERTVPIEQDPDFTGEQDLDFTDKDDVFLQEGA